VSFSGWVSLIVGVIALFIAYRSLIISQKAQTASEEAQKRALNRERLMGMQELLNTVAQLRSASRRPGEPGKTDFLDRRRWMRTVIAAYGLREALPQTVELSKCEWEDGSDKIDEAADAARGEIDERLEYVAERTYEPDNIIET
jgi:hypothetical protein